MHKLLGYLHFPLALELGCQLARRDLRISLRDVLHSVVSVVLFLDYMY